MKKDSSTSKDSALKSGKGKDKENNLDNLTTSPGTVTATPFKSLNEDQSAKKFDIHDLTSEEKGRKEEKEMITATPASNTSALLKTFFSPPSEGKVLFSSPSSNTNYGFGESHVYQRFPVLSNAEKILSLETSIGYNSGTQIILLYDASLLIYASGSQLVLTTLASKEQDFSFGFWKAFRQDISSSSTLSTSSYRKQAFLKGHSSEISLLEVFPFVFSFVFLLVALLPFFLFFFISF
jgi:hypothetical protein